ncbi:MAG: hypothetical protein EOO77_33035 [Oxalobacteraceae bacterium]|nr:MAG: hypothetical protein EOO77_33035 [Oxalobacteraceae bacterium]
MLTSNNPRKRPVPPPPDYARYKVLPIRELIDGGRHGRADKSTVRERLRDGMGRWHYAFVFDKFDEWGTIEVHKWCEERWGRSFDHPKNSKRHDKNARWWALDVDYIVFSHEAEAIEFKMRWV